MTLELDNRTQQAEVQRREVKWQNRQIEDLFWPNQRWVWKENQDDFGEFYFVFGLVGTKCVLRWVKKEIKLVFVL